MNVSRRVSPHPPVTTERACPVCGSHAAILLQQFDLIVPDGYPLDARLEVVLCQRCGMAFNNSRSLQSDYDHYYHQMSKYDDACTTTGAGLSGWDRDRLVNGARWIAERFSPQTRVIDVGCATGGLLQCLKDLGFSDLVGVDPSEKCVSITRSIVGEAHLGSVFRLPEIAPGRLCILYAVLEHIRDVRAAIATCRRLLQPGGCLYVVVPDGARYARYAPSPFQDFNTEHINHFSVNTLDQAVCQEGFVTIECGPLDIPTHAGTSTAIEGLWRRDDDALPPTLEFDDAMEPALGEYISISDQRLQEICTALQSQLVAGTSYLVWGTGQLLFKLLGLPPLSDTSITGFIDSNPINQGGRLRGVEVISPSAAAQRQEPIIIASVLAAESIAKQIRNELRMPNPLIQLPTPR